jgi:hypothetical protein
VLQTLQDEGLAYWGTMSHGGRPSGEDGDEAESICLSAGDKLYPQDVAGRRLPGTIVHHDCCVVGTTHGRGGGRFDGHPSAALFAGASCVLASAHPLWDDAAAQFSEHLYERLLEGQPVGSALLETRRALAGTSEDNPLLWATTVLWGNPWATLVPARAH